VSEGDVALRCASALVDGLVVRGVRDACVSPGSRSTPLALALARHPAIDVHVHLDERASGFFALGLAKASGAPVAVACTSGTAAANLLPAIVEASTSRVPLVVLTADRPPELRGVGANQTIDQVGLFGRYARFLEDAPVAGDEPDESRWRERGEDAVVAALTWPFSPVHLNLPFREPLVPTGTIATQPELPSARWTTSVVARGLDRTEDVVDLIADVPSGVVLAGGLREPVPGPVVALARRLAWPLIAEPHSGCRVPGALEAGRLLLDDESFAAAHRPDVVLQIGAAPTSRAALALVRGARTLAIVDPDDVVGDPHRRAEVRAVTDVEALGRAVDGRVPARDASDWLETWRAADASARRTVDEVLDGWDEPFEGRVARDLVAAISDGSTLCVGSSLPIRDVDAFMRPRDGIRILANRGASGIDGFVSTSLGAAAAGRPTFALMGDLTLLHDIGSLVWSAGRGQDLVIVVPNNGGGAIFATLEQRTLPELDELFVTPHGVEIGAVVRSAGAGHVRVDRADALAPAVDRAASDGGVRVVEVCIDAELDRKRRDEVRGAVAEAVR